MSATTLGSELGDHRNLTSRRAGCEAASVHRSARLFHGNLSRSVLARRWHSRAVRTGQPFALLMRCAARIALSAPAPAGQAVPGRARRSADIAVDIRVGSPQFGKGVSVLLPARTTCSLTLPKALRTDSQYAPRPPTSSSKCSDYFDAADDRGVLWDDPDIGIDWQTESPCPPRKTSGYLPRSQIRRDQLAEATSLRPRLLYTGAHGQVGWHLQRTLAPSASICD